jgi:glutamate/tyrosine decarboxylase-like PLP-dependent enzyme
LGADWLASALDQNGFNWTSSPLSSRVEEVATSWLRELFGLSPQWSAAITTGTTAASFVGLAAARRWWGMQHGVDVDEDGFAGLPAAPVFSSGYLHASAVKALGMAGLGRRRARIVTAGTAGRLDVDALERELVALHREPSILIATAGDVNTGDFDPIARMAELAADHNAWLHVDGAFGLFAAVSPSSRHLVDGIDAAHSIAVDMHKWLNVPYESGCAFVRDARVHAGAFSATAAYIRSDEVDRPVFGNLAPEMSRRARALPIWASLRAYGHDGIRAMVERHLELARRVAAQVDAAPELERLADVNLNVVCFRYRPEGVPEDRLDELNRKLAAMILEDGRVFFGTTDYAGKVAFRPAIVNWRTGEEDVDLIVAVVRELGAKLLAAASA